VHVVETKHRATKICNVYKHLNRLTGARLITTPSVDALALIRSKMNKSDGMDSSLLADLGSSKKLVGVTNESIVACVIALAAAALFAKVQSPKSRFVCNSLLHALIPRLVNEDALFFDNVAEMATRELRLFANK
jgi:hypothetical protein